MILSSSNPGDLVLDPFFGTGTTGAVAKKLHRRFIGIEREAHYVHLARERIQAVTPELFLESTFDVSDRKRLAPRVPFSTLIEYGLLQPGQNLYFRLDTSKVALIKADGSLKLNGYEGSIHSVGKQLLNGAPCNGWDNWYYSNAEDGVMHSIDELRQAFLEMTKAAHQEQEEE